MCVHFKGSYFAFLLSFLFASASENAGVEAFKGGIAVKDKETKDGQQRSRITGEESSHRDCQTTCRGGRGTDLRY